MIRYYYIYPLFYKLFSTNKFTKNTYRYLANRIGSFKRKRKNYSFDQERIIRKYLDKYCFIEEKDKFIELGTGWIHRYSLFIKAFYNNKMTLYDVLDNRQFSALKFYIHQMMESLKPDEQNRIDKSVNAVYSKYSELSNFDELYEKLESEYVLDKSGTMNDIKSNNYKVAFSCNVFEHVDEEAINAGFFNNLFRILESGGYTINIIDISDHLHVLDPKGTDIKEYLKISPERWKKQFQSDIKYINRLQESDWVYLFKQAGFKLLYKDKIECDIRSQEVSDFYKTKYDMKELRVRRLFLVHQKPYD